MLDSIPALIHTPSQCATKQTRTTLQTGAAPCHKIAQADGPFTQHRERTTLAFCSYQQTAILKLATTKRTYWPPATIIADRPKLNTQYAIQPFWNNITFAPLQPTGHYMYHQINNQQLYVLPTQCIYMFCVDLRTNSDKFPIKHQLTGFYNRNGVYCVVRTGYLNII